MKKPRSFRGQRYPANTYHYVKYPHGESNPGFRAENPTS